MKARQNTQKSAKIITEIRKHRFNKNIPIMTTIVERERERKRKREVQYLVMEEYI